MSFMIFQMHRKLGWAIFISYIQLLVQISDQVITSWYCLWQMIWLVKNCSQEKAMKDVWPSFFANSDKGFYEKCIMRKKLTKFKKFYSQMVIVWYKSDNYSYVKKKTIVQLNSKIMDYFLLDRMLFLVL